MTENSATTDIHRIVDEKIASGVTVTVNWITRCILELRGDISGDDAEFYRECASRDIGRIARSVLGKYDADDVTPRDLLLPGFEHLCRAYSLTRCGEVVLVPVALCTDEELVARAAQLDDMAKGCRSHAREIREYVSARAEASVAA